MSWEIEKYVCSRNGDKCWAHIIAKGAQVPWCCGLPMTRVEDGSQSDSIQQKIVENRKRNPVLSGRDLLKGSVK
jgi:hypothetical protein